MSEFDAQTILNLTAVLAHNQLVAYNRRAGLTDLGDAALALYAQQLAPTLAPGLVAFVGRLTANLPFDFDPQPILARFFADPAAAELDGARAVADALLAAGWPAEWLELSAVEEALAAWNAVAVEIARLDPTNALNRQYAQQAYHTTPSGPPPRLRADMANLVQALAGNGLSRVAAGQVFAADGTTVLFSWNRQTSAKPPAPHPPAPEPPTAATEATLPPTTGGEPAGGDEVVSLRLDAAAPPQVTTGQPFDLAAAIRRVTSPVPDADDLTQHESAAFAAMLPAGAAFVSLRIQIAAPDCDIHGGDTRPVRLFRGQDGPTVYFQLTPRRAGPLSIIVTVYQEADWIGSTRLRTEAGEGAMAVESPAAAVRAPRAAVVMNVVSQPLGNKDVNVKQLRDALDDAYSDAELRDLCFELEVDYEDLPGDGQSAKARELVLYCQRRGRLAALVACVMRDRPLSITN